MKTYRLGIHLTFSATFVAGCGQIASNNGIAPSAVHDPVATTEARRTGWIDKVKLPSTILYVAYAENATVTLYDAESSSPSPRLVGIISEGITSPVALATDQNGDLFVANATSGSSGNVEEYVRGATSPSATYTSQISNPAALAVDSRSTLYVANARGPAPSPLVVGPQVVEFPKGSIMPVTTVSDPNAESVSAMAVDAQRNVYLANISTLCCPVPAIDELVPNPNQPTVLGIAQVNSKPFGGIALDDTGNILASNGSSVDIYTPSTMTWPSVVLPTSTFGQRGEPAALAFDPPRQKLFVVDLSGHDVIGYAYPGGQVVNLVFKGLENPVAVAVGSTNGFPKRSPQPARTKRAPSPAPGTIYLPEGQDGAWGFDAQTLQVSRKITENNGQASGVTVSPAKSRKWCKIGACLG